MAEAGGGGEALEEANEPKEAPDAADATEPGESGHARALASCAAAAEGLIRAAGNMGGGAQFRGSASTVDAGW